MRYLFPSTSSRAVFSDGVGKTVTVTTDEAGKVLADIQTTGGVTISGSTLTIGANSLLPDFLGPDDVKTLYARHGKHTTELTPYFVADTTEHIDGGTP